MHVYNTLTLNPEKLAASHPLSTSTPSLDFFFFFHLKSRTKNHNGPCSVTSFFMWTVNYSLSSFFHTNRSLPLFLFRVSMLSSSLIITIAFIHLLNELSQWLVILFLFFFTLLANVTTVLLLCRHLDSPYLWFTYLVSYS